MPSRAASFRPDTVNLLMLFWLVKPSRATSLVTYVFCLWHPLIVPLDLCGEEREGAQQLLWCV